MFAHDPGILNFCYGAVLRPAGCAVEIICIGDRAACLVAPTAINGRAFC
jgi:hypothetical protein